MYVKAQLEYEPDYNDSTVHRFNNPSRIYVGSFLDFTPDSDYVLPVSTNMKTSKYLPFLIKLFSKSSHFKLLLFLVCVFSPMCVSRLVCVVRFIFLIYYHAVYKKDF